MRNEVIVFDMDGVLVDVSDSYRETIIQTVAHFTGRTVTREDIEVYKNRGGFNNDWLLSQVMARDLGVEVSYGEVVDRFNRLFFGTITDGIPDGLMSRERWLPEPGLLESLATQYQLALFTGRLREEAMLTLRRFCPSLPLDPLICADDVSRGKPDPEGLESIRRRHPKKELWYVGDTVDDARSASAAGVPFIGIARQSVPFRERLLELFEQESAIAVIEDVNQLPGVINQR
ncbi:MAG: HAD-IA family hydrolase [Bryobacteraceae bacterium]